MSDEKQTPSDEESVVIRYCVSKDGTFSIDVDIEDFDEESVENLALLFSSIGNDAFDAQALLIIKDAFLARGQELAFTTFLTSTILKKKIMEGTLGQDEQEGERRDEDDPIIKPTDLL